MLMMDTGTQTMMMATPTTLMMMMIILTMVTILITMATATIHILDMATAIIHMDTMTTTATAHMMTTMVPTTHIATDMQMTTTVDTAILTVTLSASVDVPDLMLVTVLHAFPTLILMNTATVFVIHTGLVRTVTPTADHATTNATAAMAQMHLTVATVYLMLTGTSTTSVNAKMAGKAMTALAGPEPVLLLVSQTCAMAHPVVTVRSVLITPHGTNTDTVSVIATGPENPAILT